MSLDIITKSQFPLVGDFPGVPLMARAALSAIIDFTSVLNIARVFATQAPVDILFQATKAAPVWGVFNSQGNRVIDADNVMEFDYRNEYTISNFPVQQGAFASYNKVAHPFETSIVLTKGGSELDRALFLQQCQTVSDSLDTYYIFTPERDYLNVNCTRMQLSRKDVKGAFFLVVELFFTQIVEVDAQYSASGSQGTSTANAANPDALPPVNNGTVQALPPTAQTQTATANKLTTGM